MYTNSIHEQSLLEAAQQGNSDAIALLLQNALTREGITVNAKVHQSQLDIVLTGKVQDGPQACTEWVISFIQQSLRQLQPQHITTVQITWRSNDQEQAEGLDIRLSPSQLLSASQIEALADAEMQSIAIRLGQPPSAEPASQPHVSIGRYLSQFTPNGLLVANHSPATEFFWQKRQQVDPAYIGSPITRLLNRQTELKAAISTLQAGGTTTFSGEFGSGKTALLRALCHHPQLLPRFPGGIIYQRVYERPLDDLIQNVFDALYQERREEQLFQSQTNDARQTLGLHKRKPTAAERYQYLSQHQLCLVLDEIGPSGESFRSLAQWSNLALLAASSPSTYNSLKTPAFSNPSAGDPSVGPPVKAWQSAIPNSRHLPIKGLSIKDAVVLFEEGLGRSLQPTEEKEAEKLCVHLGGHPRRLIQMAALIRQRQASLPEIMNQLHQGTVPEAIVLKAVSGLPESDRRVVAILAAFNGAPVRMIHLPALADLDSVTAQLTALVEQGVVWTDGTVYVLADNLLAPLQQHWQLAPWIDQAVLYFKSWLEQLAGGHQDEQSPDNSHRALATLKPILENSDILWYLICHAVRYQKWSDVLDMGRLLEPGLWLGQQWGRWRQVLLLQWQAARSLQDKSAVARVLHQLGSHALCLEDGITAHVCLAQAFEARMELGDLDGADLSQHNLNVLARSFFALETVVTNHSSENHQTEQPPLASMTAANNTVLAEDTNVPLDTILSHPSSDQQTFVSSQGQNPSPQKPKTVTAEPSSSSQPVMAEDLREEQEDAVLEGALPSWFSWIWLVLGGGSIALIGLIAVLLGQEPKTTDISKLRSKHTFPPQRIGVISEPHKFTITNTAADPITINVDFEKGERQDFALNSNDCVSQPLLPDETCAIAATFEPQEKGPRAASFMVQIGQKADPKRLTLQGVGAEVKAEVQPLDITFESQPVSERSKSQKITLKNKGTVAFMVKSSDLFSNEENAFFIERDTCFGQILQPRDDCSVEVSFLPPSSKQYRSNLEIIDDRGQELWRVVLTGEGMQPPAAISAPIQPPFQGTTQRSNRQPAVDNRSTSSSRSRSSRNGTTNSDQSSSRSFQTHQFTVKPDMIAFEQQELNSAASRTLRIQNTGTRSLELETITVGGLPFSLPEASCLEQAITPGNECVVAINFTPIEAQTYATSLTITSTQAGSKTINVNGTGIAALEPIPSDNSESPSDSINQTSLAINRFVANPSSTLSPNDVVELCYDLSNTGESYIINQTTGEQIDISPQSFGCISQTVVATTTYTLVAFQETGEVMERSLTITIAEPDFDPPSAPVAIAPKNSHFIYCNGPVILQWQAVTDEGAPVSYRVNLQRQDISISDTDTVDPSSTWTSLSSKSTDQTSLNISDTAQSPHLYRWQVQTIDAAGNTSPPTDWNDFLCINP